MKISLIMATKNPAQSSSYINHALSIAPLFDEVIVHSNYPVSNICIPSYKNLLILSDEIQITCPDALNKCLTLATGDWIFPICDDDFCDYYLISQMIDDIKRGTYDDIDVVCGSSYYGNESQGWQINPAHSLKYKDLREVNRIPFMSFFKKSLWSDVRGYKNICFSDWVFWLEAMKIGKKFFNVNIPYSYWRRWYKSEKSLSENESIHFSESCKKVLDYIDNH